jgi:DNA-binding transcriptional MerR regulator
VSYPVGEVARMTGLTVRTLHHYDEIGLVVPDRSGSDHRRYGTGHLEALQQVLFFRELGFPLDEIREIMNDPGFDRRSALVQQRSLVEGKLARLQRMIDAIDLALLAGDEGMTMDPDDMFDGFQPPEWAEEAKQRWGDTEAYQESQRRTGRYGKREWAAIQEEAGDIARRFGDLKRSGAPADGPAAVATAEEHRHHIDRWFYPCSPDAHTGLGEMYVADARFSAYWDAFEPDLAGFVCDAIMANAG